MIILNNKQKIIIISLSILSILFISCGIFGFILHKKQTTPTPNVKPENTKQNGITYKYYLENEETNKMPENTIITNEDGSTMSDDSYIFKKYSCTNNINGEFDSENWKFIPEKETNETCSLYFVKAKYNIKLNLSNAIEDEGNTNIIERENNAVFKIIPNEGYIFKEITCSNNKEAKWNEKNKTVELDVIMQDTECNVTFEKQQFKINLTVKNGTGSITENVYYGDNKAIIVTPNKDFKNATLSCTNDQTVTFDNNTIFFEKITNNTTCTLTFKKETIVHYTLTMEDITNNENISLVSENVQTIKANETGTIILRTNQKDIPQLNCGDVIPMKKEIESTENAKTIEYTFREMKSDITCRLN